MNPVVITADRLWDGTGGAAIQRPVLRILSHRVDRVTTEADSLDGQRYDFPGCTILPGLIDTHVHLVMSAADTNEAIIAQVQRETDEQLLDRALANAKAA